MAERLLEIDSVMAAFRGLTAEEEAASGFMHCLKERGYQNADKLNPWDHVHKNAITPFLDSLGLFFAETIDAYVNKPALKLQGEGKDRRLMLGLFINVNGHDQWAYPIPPLNFTVTTDEKRLSFQRQIDFLSEHRWEKNILAYIKDQANTRNQLLYARPDGYRYQGELNPDYLATRTVRVMALLRAYLLVQPYKERLTFVQDSLNAYLVMIGKLKENDLN